MLSVSGRRSRCGADIPHHLDPRLRGDDDRGYEAPTLASRPGGAPPGRLGLQSLFSPAARAPLPGAARRSPATSSSSPLRIAATTSRPAPAPPMPRSAAPAPSPESIATSRSVTPPAGTASCSRSGSLRFAFAGMIGSSHCYPAKPAPPGAGGKLVNLRVSGEPRRGSHRPRPRGSRGPHRNRDVRETFSDGKTIKIVVGGL